MSSAQPNAGPYKHGTYVELCFERLLSLVYGKQGAGITAGWTSLSRFKKCLQKLFRTLKSASERSILGDEVHKREIVEACDSAMQAVGRSRTIDEVTQIALKYTFSLSFMLLGGLPRNERKAKAGWQSNTALSEYRTLVYVRTPKQKVAQMRTYAYQHSPSDEEDTQFTRIIDAQRRHPHDDQRLLEWIRTNEPELFARFNKA